MKCETEQRENDARILIILAEICDKMRIIKKILSINLIKTVKVKLIQVKVPHIPECGGQLLAAIVVFIGMYHSRSVLVRPRCAEKISERPRQNTNTRHSIYSQ
jgi:hypothetical protein